MPVLHYRSNIFFDLQTIASFLGYLLFHLDKRSCRTLSDLSLCSIPPAPSMPLKMKTKNLINFCIFASFPPGWELKSKLRNAARLDQNEICLGPHGPLASRASCPSHQEVTWWGVRAFCVAAKWGSEVTLGLATPSYICFSWLWAIPTLLEAARQWGAQ